MNKEDRDRKKRRKAENRAEAAAELFISEMNKADRYRDYYPDLEDLEMLARYFEGAAKAIKKLNDKAIKKRNHYHEEIPMDSDNEEIARRR